MIKVDMSFIIQIINFLFLIWALNVVLYRPIRGILARRYEKVSGLENGIVQFEQDVLEKQEAIKVGRKEARAKGVKEKEILENQAKEEEMRQIEKINERARADLALIREKIVTEAEDVRKSLQKEVDSFANDISSKILGRAV